MAQVEIVRVYAPAPHPVATVQIFTRGSYPSASGTPPDAFDDTQWIVSTGELPGEVLIQIYSLPNPHGTPIAAVQYDAGDGWVFLPFGAPGVYQIIMPGVGSSYSFRLRAISLAGYGLPSPPKSAPVGEDPAWSFPGQAVVTDTDGAYATDNDGAFATVAA